MHVGKNRLANEKSPYLLQHKNNPVWWYPWGPEAFAAAREQGKPIFLSIGYSTCYWCHVMEQDSFEQADVAEVLNANFICVKVDREERPDVDNLYMQAVLSLNGQGGWPMSVFLTPKLEPFWGGTFFYRDQFLQVLKQIHAVWDGDKPKVEASAEAISAYLKQHSEASNGALPDNETLLNALAAYKQTYDANFGGFGGAPKFPPSQQLSLLLRIERRSKNAEARDMALMTLASMARGGIYDHLGGGFHRYSTDRMWNVPHFEKMLYDNALLAFTYLEGFQALGDSMFAGVAKETLDYLLRDMQSPDGAFYSAEDAGGVGKEGEYYIWTTEELKTLLAPEEMEAVSAAYCVHPDGNFEEGRSILNMGAEFEWQHKSVGAVASGLKKLFEARKRRQRPHLDDKVLTSWNGLTISALCKGFQVLGNSEYLLAAQRCATFLQQKLYINGALLRRHRAGEAKIAGCLEDYAYLIEALLHLYESDFDSKWLMWAKDLQTTQDAKFWDLKGGGYFFSEAEELLTRQKEFIDGAVPSGNSVSIVNLLRLHAFFGVKEYSDRAQDILKAVSGSMHRHPAAFPKTMQGLDFLLDRSKEIVIIRDQESDSYRALLHFVNSTFLPNKAVMSEIDAKAATSPLPLVRGRNVTGDKIAVYVCEKQACSLPTMKIEEAKEKILPFAELR